jgi:hypothetical protein
MNTILHNFDHPSNSTQAGINTRLSATCKHVNIQSFCKLCDKQNLETLSATSKMLSLVLSLELLSLVTYHLSSNHSTGSRLRNASNTKSFLSPTTHFSFPNPLISAPSSLYNHLAQPARLPLSHFSVHPSALASNSLVVLSAIVPLYLKQSPSFHAVTFPKVIVSNSFSANFH